MKIGVISDVHGNLPALEAVLAALSGEGVDEIWCAGDLVGYYPRVNECIALVRERGITCVKGNHDAMVTGHLAAPAGKLAERRLDLARDALEPDHAAWLAGLPLEHRVTDAGREVRMLHGSPADPLEAYVYPDDEHLDDLLAAGAEDVLILGHTHWPLAHRTRHGVVLNPGSCGQPRDRLAGVSFAILEAGEVCLKRVGYDLQAWTEELRAEGLPEVLIDALWRGESAAGAVVDG